MALFTESTFELSRSCRRVLKFFQDTGQKEQLRDLFCLSSELFQPRMLNPEQISTLESVLPMIQDASFSLQVLPLSHYSKELSRGNLIK